MIENVSLQIFYAYEYNLKFVDIFINCWKLYIYRILLLMDRNEPLRWQVYKKIGLHVPINILTRHYGIKQFPWSGSSIADGISIRDLVSAYCCPGWTKRSDFLAQYCRLLTFIWVVEGKIIDGTIFRPEVKVLTNREVIMNKTKPKPESFKENGSDRDIGIDGITLSYGYLTRCISFQRTSHS